MVVNKEGRFGFVDSTGKVVIGFDRLPNTTEDVGVFSEGLAAIFLKQGGAGGYQVGYIDETGQMVIAPQFFFGNPFAGGVALVETQAGSRYINRRGEFVNPGTLTGSAGPKGLTLTREGFTDRSGKLVISGYGFLEPFTEGLAAVVNGRGLDARYGFINMKGKLVIPFRFVPRREHHGFIAGLSHFSEGRASVKLGERFGYINKKGKFVVPPQFIAADDFSEGLAFVASEDKAGYIDKKGHWIILAQDRPYAGGKFKEGLAAVTFKTEHGIKMGYINQRGDVIIPPRFDYAGEFVDGIARIYETRNQSGRWKSSFGYIDKTGKYIWEPQSGP